MSKVPTEKIKPRTNDEIKTTDVDEEEIKKKYKSEIRALRQYISQPVSSCNMKFKDICVSQNDNVAGKIKGNFSELIDVEAQIVNELYVLAGFCCKKMGDRFIFAFRSFENNLYSDKNWIELLKIEECWHLGKWVMPLTVDVKAIFVKYTINSAGSMKLFLRECKHRLDCFLRRQYEYMKLQAFLLELGCNRASVQTNYAYTRITIKLVKAVCQSPEEARYIIVLLGYKNEEARPCKMTIDCEDENPLSDVETKDLKALFKRVKEQDLKEAVENALNSEGSPFIWKQASEDRRNSIIDQSVEEDSDGEMSFLKTLKKKPRAKKKQDKVLSKKDENVREISDLDIDAADQSDVSQFSEEDASQVAVPKTVKTRKTKAADTKNPRKKSLLKSKVNTKAKKVSKTRSQPLGKRSLKKPLKNGNDNASDTRESDAEGRKSVVAEIFKPNPRETKGFLEANNTVDNTASQQPAKRINKSEGGLGEKTTAPVKNSPVTSVSRSQSQLTCSTPIVGRTANLSTVAEENISAIVKENTIIATEITGIKKKDERGDSDESNLDESAGKDITKVEMDSHRELLKDLQALKENVLVTKKPVKRKGKSLAGGKKKVARK